MDIEKEKVIKTKQSTWKGKPFTLKLTDRQLQQLRKNADVCKLNGHDYDYFINQMLANWWSQDWPEVLEEVFKESCPVLAVGMGATMNLHSDRRAMTIVEIVSPKKIVVAHNETKCIDYYAGDYKVLDTMADYMGTSTFTLRRNGTWVEEGQPKKYGSVTLTVGFRRHYIDPSF